MNHPKSQNTSYKTSDIFQMNSIYSRWSKYSEYPLVFASLLYLATYSVQVLIDSNPAIDFTTQLVIWLVWGIFLIDYIVRLATAPERKKWFWKHSYELIILALPLLRPLRLLRLLTLVHVFHRSAGSALRGKVVIFAGTSSILLVYCGALAVFEAERSAPNAVIRSFGDSIWWAIITITTVGYGDMYPVTALGKIIAILLIISGIVVIGILTAALASWFVEEIKSEKDAISNSEIMAELKLLRKEIKDISSQEINTDRIKCSHNQEIKSFPDKTRNQ
jgi:voltage-gated potassium channel